MTYFSSTDLIINSDGSTYHLHIRPEQLPHKIILVGDPERVPFVSKYFDKIIYKVHKREFVSHIGQFRNQPIAVVSSGIGADNVEIVMNELDALVNIDFKTRYAMDQKISLELIRIGTSGSIQEDIPVDSFLVSKAAIGFDNLAQFYGFESKNMLDTEALNVWCQQINYKFPVYGAKASEKLIKQFSAISQQGFTLTAPGFYAPQGRTVRMKSLLPDFLSDVSKTKFAGETITNIEMETAAYYAFSASLGHEMISLNTILANRLTHEFSKNPENQIKCLIELALDLIA